MLLPRKWALGLGLLAAAPSLTVAGPMAFPKGAQDSAASPTDRGNQDVADEIGAALGQARLVYKDVKIEYQGGVATIRGQIKDAQQRALVTRIASEIPGVRTVENRLALMDTASAGRPAATAAAAHTAASPVQHAAGGLGDERSHAQQISHETEAPLSNQAVAQSIADALTSAGLSGYDIEIRYKNGVASLMGAVDAKEQAFLAQRATSSVPGVSQVLNRLTVNGQPVAAQAPPARPGYGPQGMPPQGMPPQGMPPQAMQQAMLQQQAMMQQRQAMAAQQGMVPAGYQQGAPVPGMPPQGAPPQGMPQYGQVQQTGHQMYNQPNMPNYAWPSYAPYDNSAAISYPTQYDASAFPYIGPYYPYPQVPMGWRKSTLEWDDGNWSLKFDSKTDKWWWFMNPHNWH